MSTVCDIQVASSTTVVQVANQMAQVSNSVTQDTKSVAANQVSSATSIATQAPPVSSATSVVVADQVASRINVVVQAPRVSSITSIGPQVSSSTSQDTKTLPIIAPFVLNIVFTSKVDQTWSIARIAIEQAPPSWKKVFDDAKAELADISKVVDKEELKSGLAGVKQMSLPLRQHVFRAFEFFPPSMTKVIIVGQDPYPQIAPNGLPVAQGMSFSVHKDAPVQPSLKNIFKELCNTIKDYKEPTHGDLTQWAQQGVLMLNLCLTVQPGRPASHGVIWMGFVKKVLDYIATFNQTCIVIMWGAQAQKLKARLPEKFVTLVGAHPSPMAANRGGFFGGDYFNKCNELLIKQGKTPINWQIS